jgi:hypothetical protein
MKLIGQVLDSKSENQISKKPEPVGKKFMAEFSLFKLFTFFPET